MNWYLEGGIWKAKDGHYWVEKGNGGYYLCSDLHEPHPDYPNAECWMKWFLTLKEAKEYAELI
jgi:hypothetical protein